MRPLLLVVLFLVALGVTLALLGVFSPSEPVAPSTPPAGPPEVPTPPEGGPDLASPEPGEPAQEPPPDAFPLDRPVRVLLVARAQERFNVHLTSQWKGRMYSFRTWFQHPTPDLPAPRSEGRDPIDVPPSGRFLEEEDPDVVVVQGIDAKALPDTFWETLKERVKAGRTGLLYLADALATPSLLAHPPVTGLFPVGTVKPFEGTPPPGVLKDPVTFALEPGAEAHPAVHVVAYPGWNKRVWQRLASGTPKWTTPFGYPVETAADGATVLLRLDSPRQSYPVLVASDPSQGRVLWMGAPDFGDAAWREPYSAQKLSILTLNWVSWLAGRV